jgi:hypothetical protein
MSRGDPHPAVTRYADSLLSPNERIAIAEALVADYETRLSAVMPPDFKDWHENSRQEWPEIAASTITALGEQVEFFRRAFMRSDTEVKRLRGIVPDYAMYPDEEEGTK